MTAGRALVVGASGDIGSAVSVQLAQAGYELILWGRDVEKLSGLAARCAPAPVTTMTVDLRDRLGVHAACDLLKDSGRLGAVIWAAGTFDWAPTQSASADTWADVLDVNLTAAAMLTTLLAPTLINSSPSALIYIGSLAGREPFANNASYVAAKHGLAGLAGATFLDLRNHNVKVCLITTGIVAAGAGLESPIGQLHPERLVQPDDVAAAAQYVLASPPGTCITEIVLQPQHTPPAS